jgi:DNA-binding transcriptional MerR regulator
MHVETKEMFCIPAKLYRIGEIVHHTRFTRQTIHNYTTMGLIHESVWTKGGHRLYDESVFEQLWRIQELRKTKTLTEIQKLFEAESPAGAVS